MVAALPQTRSDSVTDRTTLIESATALADVQQQLIETIETETAVRLFTARSLPQAIATWAIPPFGAFVVCARR